MIDVEYEEVGANIVSAVVSDSTSTYDGMGKMTEKMFKGLCVMRFTTPNNLNYLPLGCVGMF